MADDLEKLRSEINKIDSQLLTLIEARQDVARKVAKTKPAGSPVFRPAREAQLLASLAARADPKNRQLVHRLWRQLLAASVAAQKPDFAIAAPDNLRLTADRLAAGCFAITILPDSKTGLQLLASGKVDLALMDGDQLAAHAGQIADNGPVRVIGRFEQAYLLSCLPGDAGEDDQALWAERRGDLFALTEQSGYLEGPINAHLLGRIAASTADGLDDH